MDMITPLSLSQLPPGVVGRVTGFRDHAPDLEAKLREVGFAEGDEVELLARGPLGGAPLSVRLNRTVIALRRDEAAVLEVERVR